jgi:hypothetical protein
VIDPLLAILVPPALVFAWAMHEMRRPVEEAPDRARAKVEA